MNIIFTFEFISFNYPDYFIKFTIDIKEIILYILALQLSKQIFLIQIHWFVGNDCFMEATISVKYWKQSCSNAGTRNGLLQLPQLIFTFSKHIFLIK